jgi:hypothetical protein
MRFMTDSFQRSVVVATAVALFAGEVLAAKRPDPAECLLLEAEFKKVEPRVKKGLTVAVLKEEQLQDLRKLRTDLQNDSWWASSDWAVVVAAVGAFAGKTVDTFSLAAGPYGPMVASVYSVADTAVRKGWNENDPKAAARAIVQDEVLDRVAGAAGANANALWTSVKVMRKAYEFKDLEKNVQQRDEVRKVVQQQLQNIDAALKRLQKDLDDHTRAEKQLEALHQQMQSDLRACASR